MDNCKTKNKKETKRLLIKRSGKKYYNEMLIAMCFQANDLKQIFFKDYPNESIEQFRESSFDLYGEIVKKDDKDRNIKLTMFEIALDTIL